MQTRKKKPRLPLLQRASFSSGHILNDLILSLCSSYLLTYQTKILGLSGGVIGLIWLVPNAVDSFLALFLGFVCDNFAVPIISKFYGRRKSWHLIGDVLVAATFPFLFMPCLLYKDSYPEWTEAIYYIGITQINYMGYCLAHANHLALIPELAKRTSEMVELGALSSAVTFISGIFVYGVVWALLNGDKSEELSSDQQTSFTHLAIILVSVGIFFSLIFHAVTREPTRNNDEHEKNNGKESNNPKQGLHAFSTGDIDEKSPSYVMDGFHTTTHAQSLCDVIHGDKDTALVNPTFVADVGDVQAEVFEKNFDVLRSAMGEKERRKDHLDLADTVSSCSSGYGEEEVSSREAASRGSSFLSTDSTDTESVDMYIPGTFLDPVAHHSNLFLRSRPGSRIGRVTPLSSPRLQRSTIKSTPLSTPRLPRSTYYKPSPLASPRLPRGVLSNSNDIPASQGQLSVPGAEEYIVKSLSEVKTGEAEAADTVEEGLSDFVIHDRNRKNPSKRGSWRLLFKNPMFYKIGFGYMCTRMAMHVTNGYFPMFLTDHLHFGKQAIAYFPLVTLVSGVFASVATKTLNRLLGNKWTFCLGSILVMGSSLWFYSLTVATRSTTYAPAILSGCGTSIMFVTVLALAAELVDQDRSSGAFVMASMSFLGKVVLGTLFFFLQEFYPKSDGAECPACTSYIHHVFSITPGVAALMGLIGFSIFIPATVKCRRITHTVDAETQTEGDPIEPLPISSFTNEIRIEDETQTCADNSQVKGITLKISATHSSTHDTADTVEYGNVVVTHF